MLSDDCEKAVAAIRHKASVAIIYFIIFLVLFTGFQFVATLPDAEIPEIHPTMRNAKIRLFYEFFKNIFDSVVKYWQ